MKPIKPNELSKKDHKTTMKAVVTKGNGGYEQLEYCDVPVPPLATGEVLLQVLAAGVNNTEINTRLGWYSATVNTGTEALATRDKENAKVKADGGWNEATPFPLIQGTDCCGRIVEVAPGGDRRTLGLRVLVRPMLNLERSPVPTVRLKTWFIELKYPGVIMCLSPGRLAVWDQLSCSWRSVGEPL
jgi:hypothetical protein